MNAASTDYIKIHTHSTVHVLQEDSEFARQYLTHKPTKRLKVDTNYDEQVSQDNDDPTHVDWRTRDAVTPVKDQVCWAFTRWRLYASPVCRVTLLQYIRTGSVWC